MAPSPAQVNDSCSKRVATRCILVDRTTRSGNPPSGTAYPLRTAHFLTISISRLFSRKSKTVSANA
ncbi:hypothetical protein Dda_5249 [Drechslerella dactyloides]|uniref:Uncharacterized protein n=1 Tax=Drechslerella dactyloides TaxID=74499 RepID=A0AAD6IW83_DREDA|nr:hypothetical protein Dda_5249 [Drechslerella dactyloides]